MKIDLVALKKSAEAATKGKWGYAPADATYGLHFDSDERLYAVYLDDARETNAAYTPREQDAVYIALANPTTVLALLARLEAADKLIDCIRDEFQCKFKDNPLELHNKQFELLAKYDEAAR